MRVEEHRCDRCEEVLPSRGYITLTVNYHHPRTLELCGHCEKEFALWLGKHPHGNTPIEDIAAGRATGQGYPSAERAREYLETGK